MENRKFSCLRKKKKTLNLSNTRIFYRSVFQYMRDSVDLEENLVLKN